MRWNQLKQAKRPEARRPNFSAENTAQDDVVQRLSRLVTSDARVIVLQPMAPAPVSRPALAMEGKPEEKLYPGWRRSLPDQSSLSGLEQPKNIAL